MQHRFIGNLNNCSFIKYPVSIILSDLQQFLRGYKYSTEMDLIVVEALLELGKDLSVYGPFSLMYADKEKKHQYKLYFKRSLCFSMVNQDDDFIIEYILDDNIEWIEDLALLAEAHSKGIQIDNT